MFECNCKKNGLAFRTAGFAVISLAAALLLLLGSCDKNGRQKEEGVQTSSGGDAPESGPISGEAEEKPVDIPPIVPENSSVPLPAGPLNLAVKGVTSSTVGISWDAPEGTASVKIYIAPEPAVEADSPMPSEMLETELSASAGSYTVKELASSVDIFIRVEAESAGGKISEQTHARTIGGPRGVLDSQLREIHGYAPDVLQVVLKGGNGALWQSGAWKARRADGSAIEVVNKWRHSIPVSADDYSPRADDPHFYEINSDNVTETDHRIYLKLKEPIGDCEWLFIEGPNDLKFRLPFSDKYLETPVVQVNQAGYNPRASKRWAYISGWMGDGGPLPLASFPSKAGILKEPADPNAPREVVLSGLDINRRSFLDGDAGTEVKEVDLAQLPASEGAFYRLQIPGVGVSWRTAVSERAAFQAFYVVMRGLFFNRWAGDLKPSLTYWSRPQDHAGYIISTTDANGDPDSKFCRWDNALGRYVDCPEITNDRKILGGYHDAGDYDQRPMHTVVPQLLMRAFELNPAIYKDGQLNIPESGNGIPDLLDEAMWGVAAWEQLQESDGGVRQGIESYRHPLYSYANYDADPYWTYTKEANVSARAAGLFAQAARLIQPYDSAKSLGFKQRAIDAYNYAKTEGASDYYLFYPAGELFRLTGNLVYRDDFETYWKGRAGFAWNLPNYALGHLEMSDYLSGVPQGAMPDYFLGFYKGPGPFTNFHDLYGENDPVWKNQTILNRLEDVFKRDADEKADDTINSPHAHRNPRPAHYGIAWGQGTAVSRHLDTVIARLYIGGLNDDDRRRYFDSLSLAADYLLGCNPNGMVYITGLGSRRPEEPLHTDSLIFIKEGKGPMPGIPVYGPIDDPGGADYILPTLNAFYPAYLSQPVGLRYADTRPFVKGNEFSVWEIQAPEAELFSILVGPGMMP